MQATSLIYPFDVGAFSSDIGDRRFLKSLYAWFRQIWDPLFTATGLLSLPRYLRDLRRYKRLASGKTQVPIRLAPQLHDRSATSAVQQHYFFLNGWALRKIAAAKPPLHVDVGSQVDFANSVAAFVPTVFVDIRPLYDKMSGLLPIAGDLLRPPLREEAITSLSCLHVVEHIGLGRYGDELDPAGTQKAAYQLTRTLAPGGDLYLGLPIGRPHVYFNAHRVHSAGQVLSFFEDLELCEFDAVDDLGRYIEAARPTDFDTSHYACGMFHFRRPRS